jgi:hypothetical protein
MTGQDDSSASTPGDVVYSQMFELNPLKILAKIPTLQKNGLVWHSNGKSKHHVVLGICYLLHGWIYLD